MTQADNPPLLATVFSDYICPFCYVADARLQRLRADYDLKINWCFLEIHPETPSAGMPIGELGYPEPLWRRMMDSLDALAAEEGLAFLRHDFTTRSHQALLLAEAARAAGAAVFYRLHRRLFEAFFSEGRNIGDPDVLRAVARECGLTEAMVAGAWEDTRHEQRLAEYRAAAQQLDVRATPTVFFGKQQRLDGVQPLAAFRDAAAAGLREQQALRD
jgi:predicted DsbA family dithiol-disulfide isomerase